MYIVTSHSSEYPDSRAYRKVMHPDGALRLAEAMLSGRVMTAYEARGVAEELVPAPAPQGQLAVAAEAQVVELPVPIPETE